MEAAPVSKLRIVGRAPADPPDPRPLQGHLPPTQWREVGGYAIGEGAAGHAAPATTAVPPLMPNLAPSPPDGRLRVIASPSAARQASDAELTMLRRQVAFLEGQVADLRRRLAAKESTRD